jgi:hypothetical protein
MKLATRTFFAAILIICFALPAQARENDDYGETRINSLPLQGALSKTPWVGSWWAYLSNGSAYRYQGDPSGMASGDNIWVTQGFDNIEHLSPAEKYDHFVGRSGSIEYDNLLERKKKYQELNSDVQGLISERKILVRNLNKVIKEHDGDNSFNWRDTEDGERYLELQDEMAEKEAIPNEVSVDVDSAFEYEVLHHGSAQFGVEGWFGHCNAWAAAAITEPEPRYDTKVDDIPFTVGDVKAYLTELSMEIHSSFYGSRNNYHSDEASRSELDYRDVTPSAFHILFADMVGNRDQGFVIDRHTGAEVWNQPVRAYRSTLEPLYEGDTPLDREVSYTHYGSSSPYTDTRGTEAVYPVLATTTIHWMSDGVPHETLTDDSINDSISDDDFASSHTINSMWSDQVHLRTLTYELWLDKPMNDPDARIIGDGAWQHGSTSGHTQLHPDFIWVPLSNVNNSSRDYENEFFDYDIVVDKILPGSLEPADDPEVEASGFSYDGGSVDIADDDIDNPAKVTVEIDESLTINVMTVDVAITHTYIGDLELILWSPDGRFETLKEFGDGGSADNINETYDVKTFNDGDAEGTWTLEVRDNYAADTGTIEALTLHIK